MLGHEPLLLGKHRVALLRESHTANFLLRELPRECFALLAQFVEFTLRAGNILPRGGIALLNIGLLFARTRALSLYLAEVFIQLHPFVRQHLLIQFAVLHIPADDLQLFGLFRRRNFAGMHRVPKGIHLNIAAEHILFSCP
ncbi:hypothetical protein SDC9_102774 [bioreactor metagenome]|uniref:Uncharacterized protein n=1 Tax=bioreactor metagenome TaxID=1076179 RepID=A0A645ASU5_9ZZZZ